MIDQNTKMLQDLLSLALKHGANHASIIATADIPFAPELRGSCDQNYCGRFKTCWVGPPAIGDVEALMQRVLNFPAALVVQTVGQLEDSYDYEGMMAAKEIHEKMFRSLRPAMHEQFPGQPNLDLSCGCCSLCEKCTYPDSPCILPDEAVSAVEAYGINVNPMLETCGLKYNNGKDTVSYVSLFMLPVV